MDTRVQHKKTKQVGTLQRNDPNPLGQDRLVLVLWDGEAEPKVVASSNLEAL